MKKSRKLSLASLAKTEMESIKGGQANGCSWTCGCACRYSDNGGSSDGDNGAANSDGGFRSPNSLCEF